MIADQPLREDRGHMTKALLDRQRRGDRNGPALEVVQLVGLAPSSDQRAELGVRPGSAVERRVPVINGRKIMDLKDPELLANLMAGPALHDALGFRRLPSMLGRQN